MKKFITKLTIIALALALIGGLVFAMLLPQYYLPVLPFLLLFFYFATIGVHAYQVKLAKKDLGKFTRSSMLISFFKMIVYSIVAIIYIAIDKENAIPFVICLMLIYLIFTFVEVSETTRISRKQNN